MIKKKTSDKKVNVSKLKVNKETVKDLTDDEAKKVKGGVGGDLGHHVTIPAQCYTSGFCDKDAACKRK